MLDVQCTQLVRRSPETVWRYVAEEYFDHHSTWDPAVVGMRRLGDGPLGVGTEGVEEARRMGRVQRTRFRVTAFDPPRRFAFTDIDGPFALDRSYELAPHGEGTLVTFRFTMSPRGGMRLLFPLLRRAIAGQVRVNLGRLPGAVESQPLPSARER
jgi:uncharacterized protein YndB with AHSA1/START domain